MGRSRSRVVGSVRSRSPVSQATAPATHPLGQPPARQSRAELSPAGGQQLGGELRQAGLVSDTAPPRLPPGTRLLGSTSLAPGPWGPSCLLLSHLPQREIPPTPPGHIAHTYAYMYVHTRLVKLPGERAVNRWEQLQGGAGEPVGGVWKPICPPQKPQIRRDKVMNRQGPLGRAQRYTQLARSPP